MNEKPKDHTSFAKLGFSEVMDILILQHILFQVVKNVQIHSKLST